MTIQQLFQLQFLTISTLGIKIGWLTSTSFSCFLFLVFPFTKDAFFVSDCALVVTSIFSSFSFFFSSCFFSSFLSCFSSFFSSSVAFTCSFSISFCYSTISVGVNNSWFWPCVDLVSLVSLISFVTISCAGLVGHQHQLVHLLSPLRLLYKSQENSIPTQ